MTDHDFLTSMRIKSFPTDGNWLDDAPPAVAPEPAAVPTTLEESNAMLALALQERDVWKMRAQVAEQDLRRERARDNGHGGRRV